MLDPKKQQKIRTPSILVESKMVGYVYIYLHMECINALVVQWRGLPMVEPAIQGLIPGLAPYSGGSPSPC